MISAFVVDGQQHQVLFRELTWVQPRHQALLKDTCSQQCYHQAEGPGTQNS